MSKIGNISISIPEKVKVVLAGNMINIEGPLGKKSLGIAIISTPKGVMTDIDARKQRVGGEIICKVF